MFTTYTATQINENTQTCGIFPDFLDTARQFNDSFLFSISRLCSVTEIIICEKWGKCSFI